jgi:hypothetical protein
MSCTFNLDTKTGQGWISKNFEYTVPMSGLYYIKVVPGADLSKAIQEFCEQNKISLTMTIEEFIKLTQKTERKDETKQIIGTNNASLMRVERQHPQRCYRGEQYMKLLKRDTDLFNFICEVRRGIEVAYPRLISCGSISICVRSTDKEECKKRHDMVDRSIVDVGVMSNWGFEGDDKQLVLYLKEVDSIRPYITICTLNQIINILLKNYIFLVIKELGTELDPEKFQKWPVNESHLRPE